MTIIPNGTTVTWQRKTGTVLAFVPAGEYLLAALDRLLDENERVRHICPSSHARYIVAVPRGGKSRLVDLYTPYVGQVKEAPNVS